MALTDLRAAGAVLDAGDKVALFSEPAPVANGKGRGESSGVVVGGRPDVADGITDGSVDGEGHISETSALGGDEDGVDGAGANWWWRKSLLSHRSRRSAELGHAFYNMSTKRDERSERDVRWTQLLYPLFQEFEPEPY